MVKLESYRPLEVCARMVNAIGCLEHEPPKLDAVLEWASSKSHEPVIQRKLLPAESNGRKPIPNIDSTPYNFAIPVKRIGHKAENWYWSCSVADFPEGMEMDQSHWASRFDGGKSDLREYVDFAGKSEKINITAGRHKSYYCPQPLVVASVIRWFAFGAPKMIAKLLRKVNYLGKKRSQGHGEVFRWEIHEAGKDVSCWRDGSPNRPLPIPTSGPGEFQTGFKRLRPPYWHHADRVPVILPN